MYWSFSALTTLRDLCTRFALDFKLEDGFANFVEGRWAHRFILRNTQTEARKWWGEACKKGQKTLPRRAIRSTLKAIKDIHFGNSRFKLGKCSTPSPWKVMPPSANWATLGYKYNKAKANLLSR